MTTKKRENVFSRMWERVLTLRKNRSKMEEMLNEVISDEELKKHERIYYEQKEKDIQDSKAQFDYALCLVRGKFPVDIKKGILLLEDLYNRNPSGRRDYLYYLTIGNYRIREYSKALEFCRAFMEIEPANTQVQELEKHIKDKMNKEGRIGIAITMGGVIVMGALVSLIMALTKSRSD